LEEEAYIFDYSIPVKATTQYTNYAFNSMVKFGDKYLGADANGIHELDGDTDNGLDIDAFFEPILTDFGFSNPKRVRFIYMGYEADGNLLLTLAADQGAETDISVASGKTRQQRKTIPGLRSIQGRYFMFRISNVNGCDFGVDSIDVECCVMPQHMSLY
jgi:hypothetical protein